jgi:RNA recognition motif-containing protein
MPKRIFIGSLSAQTTEADLESLCRNLQDVSSINPERAEDGSLRVLVEFTTDSAGTAALEQLQGKRLHDRTLTVSAVQ